MKSFIALFLALQLCLVQALWSQSPNPNLNPSLANVMHPSPSVAALGKFGEIPVGYATGIPQINVPIFSYKNADNSLNLSVSLDYHAGGVKVDEVASNVGIGWALNAGGAVMRSVRDLPDETATLGFLNTPVLPEEFDGNVNWETSLFTKINEGYHDGQNDLFTFNFAGRSGQFVLGKNNDLLLLSPSKLKIEKEIGVNSDIEGIIKFTITDEKGIKYIFDAPEISISSRPYGTCFSSWQLTKIIAPSATDEITLEYETENPLYVSYYSYSYVIFLHQEAGQHGSSSMMANNITGKRVKRINFPNGVKLDFAYDDIQRTDLQGTYRLKKVTISDNTNARGYNLYHDYSVNRLTLKQVLPFNASGEEPGYNFEYIGSLPERFSYMQDHWGFYNNNTENIAYPHEYYTWVDRFGQTQYELPGANREVDPERVKYGSLSKITYPTSGYTEFDMEAHRAEDDRLKHEIIQRHSSRDFHQSIYVSSTAPGSITITNFQGDPNSITQFKIYSFAPSFNCSGSCYMIMELSNSANQVIRTETFPIDQASNIDYSFGVLNLLQGNNYTLKLTAMGTENLGSYIDINWTEIRLQNPDETILEIINPLVGGLRVKSIRNYDNISTTPVSKIDYDYLKEDDTTGSGTLGTYPQYSYRAYYSYEYDCGVRFPWSRNEYAPSFENYLVRTSSPILTLGLTNGSPVNYSRVIEKIENKGVSNGKIIRYFHNYEDDPLPIPSAFPCAPPDNRSWSYGQLTKELVYNKDGDLLKKTTNEYAYSYDPYFSTPGRLDNFSSVSLVPVKYQTMEPASSCHPEIPPTPAYWDYIIRPIYFRSLRFAPWTGRKDLAKTTTVEYNGTQSLTNEVTYTYDNVYNVVKTTIKNSRNELIEEVTHYPYEYTGNAVANAMIAQNMYAPSVAIEKWTTVGSAKYLLGGIVNQYQSLASGIRKSSIESLENIKPVPTVNVPAFSTSAFNRAPSLFKPAITFNQYSSKGFVAQQAKANDAPQSIIWDHNQQLPIAQVTGSAADRIAYTSFEADGLGGWGLVGGATIVTTGSITGKKALNGGVTRTVPAGDYVAGVWSTGNPSVNGQVQTQTPLKVLGSWRYFEVKLTNTTTVTVSGSNIDEVRLYPAGSQMTTYTYDPLLGITSQCDASCRLIYYEYDGFGRLKTVRDEDKNVLKTYDYQFRKNYNQ